MKVTVYAKPSCVQCDATEKALDKAQVPYTVVDLTQNPDAMAMVKDLGFLSAPVVVVSTDESTVDQWAGFRPDKITTTARIMAPALV